MNKFTDVINWLRTPEGEKWSHNRMLRTSGEAYAPSDSHDYYRGFFSLKDDEGEMYFVPLWWGDLPGDGQLALEAEVLSR